MKEISEARPRNEQQPLPRAESSLDGLNSVLALALLSADGVEDRADHARLLRRREGDLAPAVAPNGDEHDVRLKHLDEVVPLEPAFSQSRKNVVPFPVGIFTPTTSAPA